jgi:hypothetical protein
LILFETLRLYRAFRLYAGFIFNGRSIALIEEGVDEAAEGCEEGEKYIA